MATIYEELAGEPTADQIAAKLTELQGWIQARLPSLDVQDPVLLSVWLAPLASRLASQANVLASVENYGRLSSNVLDSIDDESDRQAVRLQLAASLGIEEIPASRAVGEIKLRFSTPNSVVVPRETLFTSGSLQFANQAAYILRVAEEQTGVATERPLVAAADGTWESTIPVTAVEAGAGSNISTATSLTSDLGFESLVSITASVNFVGGKDANSLQDLIDAFFAGTIARTLGTRDQVVAFMQTRTDIGPLRQCGVIGFGDPEMQRDKISFFPLGGGMADIYVASQQYPTLHTVNMEAIVTEVRSDFSRCTIGINRDVSPGYFRITAVTDVETGAVFTVEAETRGADTGPILGEQIPQISNAYHAGFSRFQTATVQLKTTQTLPEAVPGDARRLMVTFQRIPNLDIAQTAVSDRYERYVAGDTLVRAAAPIFLKIFIRLRSSFITSLPTADDIREAVVNEVERRPMRSQLHQSDIVKAIDAYLPDDLSVSSVQFEGELIRPDGSMDLLTSTDMFEVPQRPTDQLTPRTVAMYITTSDVKVSVDQYLNYETP